MRILLTNTGPWGTGSFTVADALVTEFLKAGHEVALFFPDAGLPCDGHVDYYGHGKVYRIWQFPIEYKGFSFPSFPLIIPDPHPRSRWKMTYKELPQDQYEAFIEVTKDELQKVIEEFKPDVIECQHLWLMSYAVGALGHPFFCTAHHSDQIGFEYDHRTQPYAIECAHKAEGIFTVSDYVKSEVQRLYKVDDEKISVFPNGYNKEIFFPQCEDRDAVLHELGIMVPKDGIIVSFAGKISRTKGIDVLLKANLLLQNQNVHFILLGGGDFDTFVCENFPQGIEMPRIHYVGHQPPKMVAKIHNISKFSVLPSRAEGFGIACLEAMACGRPLVVTDIGGLREFAVGELVEVDNSKALAAAIDRMCEHEGDSEEAIKKANEYSWERIAELRVRKYREAME